MYMNYEINCAYLLIQKEKMHLISFYEIVFFKHYSLINLKKIFFVICLRVERKYLVCGL